MIHIQNTWSDEIVLITERWFREDDLPIIPGIVSIVEKYTEPFLYAKLAFRICKEQKCEYNDPHAVFRHCRYREVNCRTGTEEFSMSALRAPPYHDQSNGEFVTSYSQDVNNIGEMMPSVKIQITEWNYRQDYSMWWEREEESAETDSLSDYSDYY